ncbi:MAG: hypothetical protein EZS28_012108 [Streblomastix strix]|uniref:RNase H type-1 domain-containing protein n=1 Tax=Streblomastix strix TaxID=222440 RepID=A0A5J4WBP1_9EUKA|nr:MAG: hypothetical protein EZS28_012108 [Streblomastix strix]
MELTVKNPFVILSTDASEIGWTSFLHTKNGELMVAEKWYENWHLKSSNLREMVAVLMSLRAFSPILQQTNVDCLLFQTDNTTTESCLRKWRPSKALIHIAMIISQLLKNLNVSFVTEHIKGIHNNKADALSGMAHHEDYSISIPALNQAITFLQLVSTTDLFASRTMKQCKRYYNLQQDRGAVRRNAMSFSWTGERPLIHCPIEMIPRVINKINKDQIDALLILLQQCIYKFKQLLPKISSEIDLGPSQQVLDQGPKMMNLEFKLPPGNTKALRVTSRLEKIVVIQIATAAGLDSGTVNNLITK